MNIIERNKIINHDDFLPNAVNLNSKYGLSQQVLYCSKCVISNQRPSSIVEFKSQPDQKKTTIFFDENQVCDACKVSELKKTIDWLSRREELEELCAKHRSNGNKYDCIVPGSGGKDSFYAAHILKYELNMTPLTVTWAPHLYTDWGWKNHQSWVGAGFDNILISPNKKTHRLLTRLSTELLLHPFQPFVIGQKSIASKIADQHNVELIFYGENEAEYGNPAASFNKAFRDNSFSSSNEEDELSFGGVTVRDLVGNFGLTKSDLSYYLPQRIENIVSKNIQTH